MTVFNESQKFRQWWLWTILVATLIIPIAIVFYQSYSNKQHFQLLDFLTGAIVPFIILIWFAFMRLDTEINSRGISYKFVGFHFKTFEIEWSEIKKAYIREYSPIVEYGGWGLRSGLGGKGRAYNVSGNIGLQLELKTGKNVLFGTLKPDEIKTVLKELARQKVISWDVINA